MHIQTACPNCATNYRVGEANLDKMLRCTKCQHTFRPAAPASPSPYAQTQTARVVAADALSVPSARKQEGNRPAAPAAPRPPSSRPRAASPRLPVARPSSVAFWVVVLLLGATVALGLGAATAFGAYLVFFAGGRDASAVAVKPGEGPDAPKMPPAPDKDDKNGSDPTPKDPPAQQADNGWKAAPLKADREERSLPSAVDDVCVGGGGRYLILRLPREQKLAVFDANEAKIVKYLPLGEDGARFTAGLDKLIVALPTTNVLQRWSLTTFEKEASVASPVEGKLGDVVMGSASRGPLLVCPANSDPFGGSSAAFVDPLTFKPLDLKWGDGKMPGLAPELVRASADGALFGGRNGVGGEPHEVSVITLSGDQAQARTAWIGASLLLPGPDGRRIYTSDGVYDSQLNKIYPKTGENALFKTFVPAREGGLALRLEPDGHGNPPGFPPRPGDAIVGSLSVLLPGQVRPVATLRDVEGVSNENLAYGGKANERMHFDKRIHLIPDAQLLGTIPATNDKLILRRFDLDGLLAKSDVDFLYIASQPPASVERGGRLAYQVSVKSKKGGVTRQLDSGPKGMTHSPDGLLRWDAPADFADPDADVLVKVADASGQEVFQAFKLAVVDKGSTPGTPAEVKPPPATDKPKEPPVEVKTPPAENGWKPAPLQADREERALPSSVDQVCVGGGGRYLLLRLPHDKKLAVFDAVAAKVVKYLPLAEDNVKMAAGLDKLVLALPTSNVLQRWSLTTFEKESTLPNPLPGAAVKLLMGSATRGPLVIGTPGTPGKAGLAFLDPLTFQEDDDAIDAGKGVGGFLDFGDAGSELRISANGDVITGWTPNVSPTGLTTLVREGKTYKQHYEHTTVGAILPSADGKTLFTREGLFTPEAKPIGKKEGGFGRSVWYVPAVEGAYHLSFTQSGDANKGGPVFSVAVHMAGDSRPLATLPGSKEFDGLVDWQTGQSQAFDQHVFLIPDAELLVVIPASNDKVILQRFNLASLLEKAGVDYLFVAGQPVTRAVKGSTYRYPLAVKSKKGGVKATLESGPPGMEIGADARLTWNVPADFADAETSVIVKVTDASGQEVLHTFKVTVAAPKQAP